MHEKRTTFNAIMDNIGTSQQGPLRDIGSVMVDRGEKPGTPSGTTQDAQCVHGKAAVKPQPLCSHIQRTLPNLER